MPTMSLELVENGMSIVLPPNRHPNNNNNLSSSSTDSDNESMDVVVAPPPPLTTTNSSTQTTKQQKRKRNNRRHTVQQTSNNNNKRRDTIQLFAFDSDVTSNTGENVSTGRPRRTLKAIQKFDPNNYKSSSNNGLKTGHGFSCPKCSNVCSYDSKSCDNCGLGCYYEAGVGVVTLKERSIGDSAIKKGNGGSRQSMRTPRMLPGSATQHKKKQRGTRGSSRRNTTHNTRSSRRNTTHNTRSSRRGNRSGGEEEEEEVAQVLAGFAEETAEAMSPDVIIEEGNGDALACQKKNDGDEEEVDNAAAAAGQKKNDGDEEDVPQDKNTSLVEEYKLKFEETTNINTELTEQITTLQENYDDASNLLQEKDAALDDLGVMHQSVSEERDRLEERLETLSGELTSAQMNVTSKSRDSHNLRIEMDNMRNEQDATKERMKELKSSSDSTNDRLTAEKDALVLQLEAANAKIETIKAEKEKYRAEKNKAIMNNNTNMDNGDGGTIARLQLEIEGLKQKLATAMSQITSLSDEKTSLVTKIASAIEEDRAKESRKQDFALDDEARSSIGGLKEDSPNDDDSSTSTAVGASTNNSNLLNMSRNISMEEEEEEEEDSDQPKSNKVDLNMSRNVSMEEEEEEESESQQNEEDMDDITASPVSTSKNNNGAILSPRKQMPPNIKIKSATKRRDSSLSTKESINFDESTSFSTKPKPSRSSCKENKKKSSFDSFGGISNIGSPAKSQASGAGSSEGSMKRRRKKREKQNDSMGSFSISEFEPGEDMSFLSGTTAQESDSPGY